MKVNRPGIEPATNNHKSNAQLLHHHALLCISEINSAISVHFFKVLELDSQHKQNNSPSIGRLVKDEERIRTGQWLELVLWFPAVL